MEQAPYKKAAERYFALESENLSLQQPVGYGIILEWRDRSYVGSIQHTVPEYSNEIVLLSKTSSPAEPALRDAIVAIQQGRPVLAVDSALDLEGRVHILRKVDHRLAKMTPSQTEYMVNKIL